MHPFMRYAAILLILLNVHCGLQRALRVSTDDASQIIIGSQSSPLERYAARELQRYLYQVSGTLLEIRQDVTDIRTPAFVIGQVTTNPLVHDLVHAGELTVAADDPGPQGYVLKKISINGRPLIAIAGSDVVGCLYGVYGLLADYYGIGFFLGGDVLPDKKSTLQWLNLDERKAPAMYIRGFLPWTNFPQSATVYSWEDWRFIIDQMAKMRLNFIHIHNYNGELGHNEMYHNFTYEGFMSRVWMPTARSGHKWACPGWDVNKYLFGASELFDDYDFGADCALHNEYLTNEQVFRKSASLFSKVIDYAHTRGVRIGLGLDINLIPEEYKAKPEDPEIVQARVDQIVNDYPDLDYLLCFQSEVVGKNPGFYETWRKIFMGFYDSLRVRMPRTRLAVAGWGLDPKSIETLPPDVICAPISPYSDACESGAIYGDREYWGCPWLERDFNSSEYYYPYRMHLSNTISAYENRARNMKGFYCLTWRVTDAVDAKMWYVSRAPWDSEGRYRSSEAVYREYAVLNYGPEAASEITPIINQNEPFACDFGECEGTPQFATYPARYLFNLSKFRFLDKGGQQPKEYLAAEHTAQQGIWHVPWDEGAECVVFNKAGDWIAFDSIDVGSNATRFEVRFSTVNDGAVIEVRIDSAKGPVAGSLRLHNTGGIQRWESKVGEITPISGVRTIFLHFVPSSEPPNDHEKAQEQIALIDRWIQQTLSPGRRARLNLLRCRIAAAKDHIELNKDFPGYTWEDLPGAAESWVHNFVYRVTDISSLGNVMSTQNRYIYSNYVAKVDTLWRALPVRPPSKVIARGTQDGAVVKWNIGLDGIDGMNGMDGILGFNVYRDAVRINATLLPSNVSMFVDRVNGNYSYQVSTIDSQRVESRLSIPSRCFAGRADTSAPHIVVISPPTSVPLGQGVVVKARVLDDRRCKDLAAALVYRQLGDPTWKELPMERRTKAIFVAHVSPVEVGLDGIEYFIEASDGVNSSTFPPSAHEMALAVVPYVVQDGSAPAGPAALEAMRDTLRWTPAGDGVYWYRIYRSSDPQVKPGPSTFLTFVEQGTLSFRDNGEDFDGSKLEGVWYYCVTAMDKAGNESAPSPTVAIQYGR